MFYKRSVPMSIRLLSLVFATIFIFSMMTPTANSQVVCSLDELIKELYEDLIDNGKLDCLRESATPNEAEETEEQRKKRIAAEWNSDCSFEADSESPNNWIVKLTNNYGLKKGLVDVNGDSVEKDFEDQADMCEIVRALVANGKFPEIGEDVKSIDIKLLDYIDCPGGEGQTQVCAATGKSFLNKRGWYILLEGSSITINKDPQFVLAQR
jgi:hypothetical protein